MTVRQISPRRFPSGDGRYIAMLAIRPEAMHDRYGFVFEESDGQHGRERFAVVKLPSGQLLWLIYPLGAPVSGMGVVADVSADGAACRQELLRELRLTEADVIWQPEAE